MAKIDCADCLTTYRPYRSGIALLRVLMYGFSDWWEFEDERDIEVQLREHTRNPNFKQWLINKTRTYIRDKSFAKNFKFYYQYLENKRRKNISANFLCFNCEKYYCTNCVRKHSGHFTFSKDDKDNINEWGRISVEMLNRLKAEGDQKRENMKREKPILLDVVDVRCEHDKLDLHHVLREMEWKQDDILDILEGIWYDYDYTIILWALESIGNPRVGCLHILNDNKRWIAIDVNTRCIKIFNVNNNKMTRRIKLSSSPHSIKEIPSTDPSQCLLAVSFPWKKQIHIMNIHNTPAQVISTITVQGGCEDLAYCNKNLVTRYLGHWDGKMRHLIHVMDMSGEIINIIDLHNLPGFKLDGLYSCRMSVHSESDTIYVCHQISPSCVISLSLDGQVLHSVTFTAIEPALIHVDKDQNVYVMDRHLPICKLSADLRHREKIFEKDVGSNPNIEVMTFHNDRFYLASDKGHVYIIQHNSSCGQDQREHDDETHSVQFTRRTEQLNPTIQPERRRQSVADKECNLL